jgi:hypothetical protein
LRYSIHTERLGKSPIFRTPQNNCRILVLQPFVDAVLQHQLTGFRFKRVWPHSSIPVEITVAVKKLPRTSKAKRPKITLSTAAKEVDLNFHSDLLGPLSDTDQFYELKGYRLPDLSLPSGRIIATDLLLGEGKPFATSVPPGEYPLTLITASRYSDQDQLVSLALLQFANRPVERWVPARVEEDPDIGYSVDSGTGGFCDPGAQEVLLQLLDPENTLEKRLEKEMEKAHRHTRRWVHIQTSAGSAAIFSSGDGDGHYISYFGLDAAGLPVALLTDFEVLTWPRKPETA